MGEGMTDDDRLAELFRAAASDAGAPASGFDHGDVLSASRRITARRRSALVGGAVALFAVVGVGAVVALPDPEPTASTAAAPAAADRAGAGRAAEPSGAAVPEGAPSVPEGAATPEGAGGSGEAGGSGADAAAPYVAVPAPPFSGTPLGPGDGPCADRQDPRLRAYLEQVLPEVIGASPAATTDECRPGGERYVTIEVQDGPARGLFGVSYLPPGTAAQLPAGAVGARTASGGTVIVSTAPAGGFAAPPFQERLDEVAAFLAPRL
jgi:hypothetical protein